MLPDGRYRQRRPSDGEDSAATLGAQATLMHLARSGSSQFQELL